MCDGVETACLRDNTRNPYVGAWRLVILLKEMSSLCAVLRDLFRRVAPKCATCLHSFLEEWASFDVARIEVLSVHPQAPAVEAANDLASHAEGAQILRCEAGIILRLNDQVTSIRGLRPVMNLGEKCGKRRCPCIDEYVWTSKKIGVGVVDEQRLARCLEVRVYDEHGAFLFVRCSPVEARDDAVNGGCPRGWLRGVK